MDVRAAPDPVATGSRLSAPNLTLLQRKSLAQLRCGRNLGWREGNPAQPVLVPFIDDKQNRKSLIAIVACEQRTSTTHGCLEISVFLPSF